MRAVTRLPVCYSFTKKVLSAPFAKPLGRRSIATRAAAAMAPYTLYTFQTPNGLKASVAMEELGLEYDVQSLDISTNVQKEDWFLAINPNGRIPAIVDHEAGDLPIFETGAIMWYLTEKHDKEGKFWPKDLKKQAEVMSWLMFQMGGVGPMQGQANHFVRYAPEKIAYGMHRYVNETKRLFGVIDKQLEKHDWLANDQYSIADMANFCWVIFGATAGIDIKAFPHLWKWVQKIYARPAVKKGLAVPARSKAIDNLDNEEAYKNTLEEALDIIAKADAAKST